MSVIVPTPIKKPIVYLSSPLINIDGSISSSNDYFVQLLTLIIRSIQEELNVDVIVKLSKNIEEAEQDSQLIEIYKNKEKYSGVIISPVHEALIHNVLVSHISSFNDYKELPIITIDKKLKKRVNNIEIPSVTSDWENGGACAAKSIIDYLEKKQDKSKKSVLIITGWEGSKERMDGFVKQLNQDTLERFTTTFTPPVKFTREGAKQKFLDHIKHESDKIDFIFACNDEMALGVRDAIHESHVLNVEDSKVIGFDGTKEFVAALRSPTNSILLSTLNVNIEKQVKELIANIKVLFSDTKVYPDTSSYIHLEKFEYIKSDLMF